MQKQVKLDSFIVRKNKKNSQIKKHHESSRQNSDTEVIQQVYQFQSKKQQNQNRQTCCQLILIGPFDTIFCDIIKKKLKNIAQNYSKDKFFQYLEGNYKYFKINNIDNLKKIKDDKFFQSTAKKMVKMLSDNGQDKTSNIRTLVSKSSRTVVISRQQALLLLVSMFLGLMPNQTYEFVTTFGYFLNYNYQNPSSNKCKFQKLKCIINYFNMVVDQDRKVLQQEFITFQRASGNLFLDSNNYDRHVPLKVVQVESKKIEQYYKKAAMVDFANSRIGGGVLKTGCVQQQILFVIFPQALVSKLISYQMTQTEAIVMYGLKRFSKYRNYSYDFQFDGPYLFDESTAKQQSIIIAIDAINYNEKIDVGVQYHMHQTHRQIIKAYVGFNAIQHQATQSTAICTGRWGCGAFKGDQIWKFLIQWIACSEAGRKMIYQTQDPKMVTTIKRIVKELIELSTLDVLAILEEYGKARLNKQISSNMTILEYIKKYV